MCGSSTAYPYSWLHDCGSVFITGFMCELNHLLGIKTTASTTYHPQTNSQMECVNQELETYIQMFCNHHQNDWDELLPSTEFMASNHVHLSTQVTPFVPDTGWNTCMGFEPSVDIADEDVIAFWDHMQMSLEESQAALSKAQAKYVLYYNPNVTPPRPSNQVIGSSSTHWTSIQINQARSSTPFSSAPSG